MKIKEIIHYLIGYLIGGTLFAILVPYGLYKLSISADNIFPTDFMDNIIIRIIACLFLLIGAFFGAWSNISLFSEGKGGPTEVFGVEASPRTKHLVIKGPYRYSRNPMVFGAFLCYFALAVLFNSALDIGVVIILFCLMILLLKFSEEKRLLRDFGDEYINYKQKVSMIFPWRKK